MLGAYFNQLDGANLVGLNIDAICIFDKSRLISQKHMRNVNVAIFCIGRDVRILAEKASNELAILESYDDPARWNAVENGVPSSRDVVLGEGPDSEVAEYLEGKAPLSNASY